MLSKYIWTERAHGKYNHCYIKYAEKFIPRTNSLCKRPNYDFCIPQRPVEKGSGKVNYPGPRDVWGAAVDQKFKVNQNATFKKNI